MNGIADDGARVAEAEKRVLAVVGVGRVVWGTVAAAVPGPIHRAFGVEYPGPDRGIWIRAFGVRDVLIGAAALHPDRSVRSAVRTAGIAMDLVDAAVVMSAARQGLTRRATVAGVLMAGGTATIAAVGPRLLVGVNRRFRRTSTMS